MMEHKFVTCISQMNSKRTKRVAVLWDGRSRSFLRKCYFKSPDTLSYGGILAYIYARLTRFQHALTFSHFGPYKRSILMRLVAVSNKVTFRVPTFVLFLLVVSGHRRAELVERASPVLQRCASCPQTFAALPLSNHLPLSTLIGLVLCKVILLFSPHVLLSFAALSLQAPFRLMLYFYILPSDCCPPAFLSFPSSLGIVLSMFVFGLYCFFSMTGDPGLSRLCKTNTCKPGMPYVYMIITLSDAFIFYYSSKFFNFKREVLSTTWLSRRPSTLKGFGLLDSAESAKDLLSLYRLVRNGVTLHFLISSYTKHHNLA